MPYPTPQLEQIYYIDTATVIAPNCTTTSCSAMTVHWSFSSTGPNNMNITTTRCSDPHGHSSHRTLWHAHTCLQRLMASGRGGWPTTDKGVISDSGIVVAAKNSREGNDLAPDRHPRKKEVMNPPDCWGGPTFKRIERKWKNGELTAACHKDSVTGKCEWVSWELSWAWALIEDLEGKGPRTMLVGGF